MQCSAPPAQKTLLVVDDEEGPRHSLWAIFKDDYRVLLADTGELALQLARENRVHAAVLDIRMPRITGTELLAELKKIDPATEVVMLTAYQTVETARQALRAGACDYLTKPFDIGAMCAAVAKAMDRRAATEETSGHTAMLRKLREDIAQERLQHEQVRIHQEIYASVIHDMNNPLTVVYSLIDLMHAQVMDATRLDGVDLSRIKEHLAQTNRLLLNCVRISRRYLGFLHPQTACEEGASVNQTLADMHELLQRHPNLGQNQLRLRPLEEDVTIPVNGLDLMQILLNLAGNALQSTPAAHWVEIGARHFHQPLDPWIEMPGGARRAIGFDNFENMAPILELTVADNGMGMTTEVLDRIFDPYFTTRGSEGTGLGMSIVKRLVLSAKGALTVESSPGAGAAFRVYFSCARPGARADRAGKKASGKPLAPKLGRRRNRRARREPHADKQTRHTLGSRGRPPNGPRRFGGQPFGATRVCDRGTRTRRQRSASARP